MEENKTIGELAEDKVTCYGCGEDISTKKPHEVFIDGFFWRVFAGVFCTEGCRDMYVDSK